MYRRFTVEFPFAVNVPDTVWFAASINVSVFVAVPVLIKFVQVFAPDNVCVAPFNCNS